MEKQWILVDVDGTLADADGRAKKYLRNENPDWDENSVSRAYR